MKILQVIPYFCFGGAETMCENLTYALRDLGHDVVVVSLFDERTEISGRMEAAGVCIRYLSKKPGLDMSVVPKLTKIFREERPDVVHTHLNVILYAVMAARLAGGIPCVHTVHNVAKVEAEGTAQAILNRFYYHRGWSVPVALSPEVQRTVTEFYGLDRVPVIFNGVNLHRCIPKRSYGLGDTVSLLHIGRLDEQKNHAGLLQAFAKLLKTHSNCCLNLLGDGHAGYAPGRGERAADGLRPRRGVRGLRKADRQRGASQNPWAERFGGQRPVFRGDHGKTILRRI